MDEEQIDLLVQLMDAKCKEAVQSSCAIMCSVVNAIGSQPGMDIEQLYLSVMVHLRESIAVSDRRLVQECAQELHDILNLTYRAKLDNS